jgi:hypothetical protein
MSSYNYVDAEVMNNFGSSVTLLTTDPINGQQVLFIVVDREGDPGSGYLNSGSGYIDATTYDFNKLVLKHPYADVTIKYAGERRLTGVRVFV